MRDPDRRRLVERARQRLLAHGWPRLEMLLTILVTGAVGFVTSLGLLVLDVRTIWIRYGIAVVVGVSLVLFGGLMQYRYPGADSIGDAWRLWRAG